VTDYRRTWENLGEAAMSTTEDRSSDAKLEVIVIPVSDVDRAKEFYGRLGWRLDADTGGTEFRLIQFTPPGSACSVQFGTQLTSAAPVSDVFHCATGTACRFRDGDGTFQRVGGPAADHASYGSFAAFTDPDGNGWMLQEVTTRLPGRIDAAATSFGSASELADAMRRAEAAHGQHKKRIGASDPDWPDWYARYMAAEQAGTDLPT
jgi:catechol 2,3-dioxygenase-like lactoylglutathione lyase family enzyme